MSDASVQKDMDEDLLPKDRLRNHYLFDWEERERQTEIVLGLSFSTFNRCSYIPEILCLY